MFLDRPKGIENLHKIIQAAKARLLIMISLPRDFWWIFTALPRFWPRNVQLPLSIITGADSTHEKSLVQLLASISVHEPLARVTVWDLGLSYQARQKIITMSWDLKTFDYADYPSYFNIKIDAGQYAWKPIIISETQTKPGEIVLWLDAGCVLRGQLRWLRKMSKTMGFFSPSSAGTLEDWTHPATLRFLDFDADSSLHNNLNAAIVSYCTDNAKGMDLIAEWARCAREPECIAPQGANRSNHRQDQAVLSVLATQFGFNGPEFFRTPRRPLRISAHQDID